MQQLVLGALLDDGGRGLARWLGGAIAAGAGVLLVAITAPVMLLAAASGGLTARPNQPVHLSAPAATAPVAPPVATLAEAPVAVAQRYLGVPYVFGGSNPAVGLDCSGLVQLVFRQLGVALPRTAQLQFNATARVAVDQLQPGDLVFFARTYADPNDWITHVGIYAGGGMQINAPTEGQVVSIQPVFSGFWGAHYAGAGRVRGA